MIKNLLSLPLHWKPQRVRLAAAGDLKKRRWKEWALRRALNMNYEEKEREREREMTRCCSSLGSVEEGVEWGWKGGGGGGLEWRVVFSASVGSPRCRSRELRTAEEVRIWPEPPGGVRQGDRSACRRTWLTHTAHWNMQNLSTEWRKDGHQNWPR